MDRTINLYNQLDFVAIEVNDETIYDMLAPEMQSNDLVSSQLFP